MYRKILLAVLCLFVVTGLALAQEQKAQTKDVTGTVKSVATDTLTVTDSAAKDWAFVITDSTLVIAKGATHKMQKAAEEKKSTVITDFVKDKQKVSVKYEEVEGKFHAKEVRVIS